MENSFTSSLSARSRVASFALVVIFLIQILAVIRREVMTNDEGYHTYAGFRYWQCADFGVNPEHPPLPKLLASLPLRLGHALAPIGPCPVASTVKGIGYADSNLWYYGSNTQAARADVDKVLWRARATMSIFAVTLALAAFFFTRQLFGESSALIALGMIAFEPTLIAHGALVTTDMALSAASLLCVFAFHSYQSQPRLLRLLAAGLCCGLTFSVKHSGVLIAPVLVTLACIEGYRGWRSKPTEAWPIVFRQAGALLGVFLVGVAFLWSTYQFRYAARPQGALLSLSLTDFIADTTAKQNRSFILHLIPTLAHFHLLPEAYLYGFVDVLSISNPGQSSFLLGHLYPHGVPQYFPLVVLMKSTLGMLALGLWAMIAAVMAAMQRKLRLGVAVLYLLAPIVFWMLAGMGSTLNIGYRHVLPIVAPTCCLLGAAAISFWRRFPRYRAWLVLLLAAHAISSLAVFPNEIAYLNEAFGGVNNSFRLLTDSNNDWSQALPQLSTWLQQHDTRDCWLAYDGLAQPEHSGVHCRYLIPNGFGADGPPPPATVTGTFIISGLSLSGIEWERPDLNPYSVFRASKPVAVIGGADIVYQGTFDMSQVAAVHQTVQAMTLNQGRHYAEALSPAESAVRTLASSGFAHLQLANALKGLGRQTEAHTEYVEAERIAAAQPEWYFQQRPEIWAGLRETSPP